MEHPNQTPNNAGGSEPEHSPGSGSANGDTTSGPMQSLPRIPTLTIVAFSILSLGLYGTYWLFTRTQIINQVHDKKIPMGVPHMVIGLLLVNLIFSIMSGVNPDNMEYRELASLSGLSFSLGNLFWVFLLRNRIHRITFAGKKSLFWLNGIFTFLFQVFYLQYKINEYIDDHTSESSLTA
jgi:Domain of unknown function (DUF4234)